MNETILEFGPGERLVGVLSEPSVRADRSDVAVIITNAGIVHRVGPNRLGVRLARSLAAHGHPSVRYDLPGVGDSETLGGDRVDEDNVLATRAAMGALQGRGVARRFVLVGLCSGADLSFRVSTLDPRVVGAVLIDPTVAFSTRRHRLNLLLRLAGRGLVPRLWWRLITGKYQLAGVLLRNERRPPQNGLPRSLSRSKHEELWDRSAEAFASLVRRQVRLFLVTTGQSSGVYSYRRQIFDAFPHLPGLEELMTIAQRPGATHTFTAEVDRRFLEQAIPEWLSTLPTGSPAPAKPMAVHTEGVVDAS